MAQSRSKDSSRIPNNTLTRSSTPERPVGCFATLKRMILPNFFHRSHRKRSHSRISSEKSSSTCLNAKYGAVEDHSSSASKTVSISYSPYSLSSTNTSTSINYKGNEKEYCRNASSDENSSLGECAEEEEPRQLDETNYTGSIYSMPKLSPFETFDSSRRLRDLRAFMKAWKLTAYIIPSEDEHQSEYTAAKDQRREYISGFSGSAGVAIVTPTMAALSTDGRYFLQAGRQLDDHWQLLKQGVEGYPSWQQWTIDEVLQEIKEQKEDGIVGNNETASIGVDPRLISYSVGTDLKEKCYNKNIKFVTIMEENLVDEVMKKEKYTVPDDGESRDIFIHELKYAGESTKDKLERVRKFMAENNMFSIVISSLDEIAWLLNLRGNDISFNPVFFSYLIVTTDTMKLYVDKAKINKEVHKYLKSNCENLEILPYKQFWSDLPALDSDDLNLDTVCTDTEPSYALYDQVPEIFEVVRRSIIGEFKGIKNETEIKCNREAQLKDSTALCQFFAWLEEKLQKGVKMTEMDAADRSRYYRGLQSHFRGLSFATISSSGPNSSVVHYEPTYDECSTVDPDNIFLCDSGAQYLDGTTDITRTYHFGKATDLQKKIFTLVLSGHLNVAMLNFKKGTSSYYIDSLARKPLLDEGYSYSHGTGHGIDTYLYVHSGPCGLSPSKTSYNYKPLEPGNFISDEPGCYLDNQYGFRVESDVLVTKGAKAQLKFDYLTMVPFGKNLIDQKYLSPEKISWINAYHKQVFEKISPRLQATGDKRALAWLTKETSPL